MCEKFGNIVSTKAIIDNETNKCKGYGFVDFAMGSELTFPAEFPLSSSLSSLYHFYDVIGELWRHERDKGARVNSPTHKFQSGD